MAKYCVEDLPDLLKAESLGNVRTILSRFIDSLPANAGSLIKWVAEVRRKEEEGSCLSKEEKERLFVKVIFPFHFSLLDQSFCSLSNTPCDHLQENVLQQVRDTKLFMIVHDLQCARIQCCTGSSSSEDSITRIATSVCSQGAAMLSGNLASSNGFCCWETRFKGVQANGGGTNTVISGSVVSEGNEQGVDMLLPMPPLSMSPCNSNMVDEIIKYPSSTDVLTVLLLALHPSTWFSIMDEKLKDESQTLVSTDNLPDILKQEVCCHNPSMPICLLLFPIKFFS